MDPLFCFTIVSVSIIFSFLFGRNFPSRKKQKKIFDETLIQLHTKSLWKCLRVTIDQRGPFGSNIRTILLENTAGERIVLHCPYETIQEDSLILLMRRDPKNPATVWCSSIDRLMIPCTVNICE